MNIPWKIKSAVFRFVDIFNAEDFLYFLQKNVTKRSAKPEINTSNIISRENNYHYKNWNSHKETINKYNTKGTLFEFGAGKSLIQNLFLTNVVSNQIVVDLNSMIDINLVNKSIDTLCDLDIPLEKGHIADLKDLENKYNILYKAPYDASKTDLDDDEIDICISTNTLEHIPKDLLYFILKEIKRILKKDGLISAVIDYSDHYSHTDKSINALNYLKYNEKSWKRYNHDCHYQNRLRHYDYKDIFEKVGFEILEENIIYNEDNISEDLRNKFLNYPNSWCATSGYFVLRQSAL